MEIHFCDLCNESVPQSDLEEGRAWQRGTRVVCNACQRSMSGDASRGPLPVRAAVAGAGSVETGAGLVAVAEREIPERTYGTAMPPPVASAPVSVRESSGGGGSGALFLSIVAIVFAAGAAWVVLDRSDRARIALESTDETLRVRHDELARRVDGVQATLGGELEASSRREAQARAAELEQVTRSMEELRAEIARLSQSLEAYGRDLGTLREAHGETSRRAGERATQIGAQIAELDGQLAFHNDKLIELEERVHAMAQAGGGAVFGGAGGPGPGAGAPAWQHLLGDLASSQPSVRLDALYALEKTDDLAVVPHVVPMLKDVDLFVRMAAARVLEELAAKEAVPALIDALEDPEAVVTESAKFALEKITGRNIEFEPNAAPAERAKQVKAWRDWWKKDGEAFLAGGTSDE